MQQTRRFSRISHSSATTDAQGETTARSRAIRVERPNASLRSLFEEEGRERGMPIAP